MKHCLMNGRWDYILPDHIADWDAMSMWERERNESMEEHLRGDMILYDVGSEHGAQSAIYAGFVGPENMVLIEPSRIFWPNIRLIWEHNHFHAPLATVFALIGEETYDGDESSVFLRGWPPFTENPEEQTPRAYAYIHDPGTSRGVAQWRLDDLWATVLGTAPDAITVDVEGAELGVLRGAETILRRFRPLVWVSVHPDLLARDYGATPEELHGFMRELGYRGTHLATDHEEHWLWMPT